MSINPKTATEAQLREALPAEYVPYVESRWPGMAYLRTLVAEMSAVHLVTFSDNILPADLQPMEYIESRLELYDHVHTDLPSRRQRIGLRRARQERHRQIPATHYLTERSLSRLSDDMRRSAARFILRMTDGSYANHAVRMVSNEIADRLRFKYLGELTEADWLVVEAGVVQGNSALTAAYVMPTVAGEWGALNHSTEDGAFWGSEVQGDGSRLLLRQAGNLAASTSASQRDLRQMAGIV